MILFGTTKITKRTKMVLIRKHPVLRDGPAQDIATWSGQDTT